jgi:hypothetical protein
MVDPLEPSLYVVLKQSNFMCVTKEVSMTPKKWIKSLTAIVINRCRRSQKVVPTLILECYV